MEMENSFTLDTMAIAEIGYATANALREKGVLFSELRIPLNEEKFRKVDEDLFYRNKNMNGSKEEFIPSDDEIRVEIDGLAIIFEKRDGIY